jgi:kinesin family protein 3/17
MSPLELRVGSELILGATFPPHLGYIQEADLAPEVAEEVVSTAEPDVWMESEAQETLVSQPQPLLATTTMRRESVGVEVAVLTDEVLPIVDQQQVLAR